MANLQKLNQSVSSAGDDDDEEMKVDGETIERFHPSLNFLCDQG